MVTKRRIAYYIPHSSFFTKHPYGRVAHAIGIANGLVRNGVAVTVIAEDGILNFSNRIDPRVIIKPLKALTYWSHLRMLFGLKRFVKVEDILLYRKTIFSFVWLPLFSMIYGRKRNIIISEVNGFIFDYNQKFGSSVLPRVSLLLHKLLLRRDNLVYTVNEDLKDQLTSGRFAMHGDNVLSIHNGGPDPDPIPFKPGDTLQIVYFGIVASYNDWETICKLLETRHDVAFHIVGDGPELPRLKAAYGRNNNISFYGGMAFPVFREFVAGLRGKVAGIVPHRIPNRLGSLSPIKAFDYMSLGMPLIYSDICLNGQVKDGVEGLAYKVEDMESLRAAINAIAIEAKYLMLKNNCIGNYSKHTWEARMEMLLDKISTCAE